MRRTLVPLVAFFSGCLMTVAFTAHAQPPAGPGQSETAQERKNVAEVQGFWVEMVQGRNPDVAPDYLADGLIDHGVGTAIGRVARVKAFIPPPGAVRPGSRPPPEDKVISQTVYAGGPYVLLAQDRLFPDPSQPEGTRKGKTIEMYSVRDGLIQEHWMLFPQGHVPKQQRQTEQEEKNIAVVTGFWHDVWEPRDVAVAPKYLAEGYVDHADVGGSVGRADVARSLDGQQPTDTPRVKIVSQTVYARGRFVALIQGRTYSDPARPAQAREVNVMEMFEVYDGLIQEHWMLLPAEQSASAAWGQCGSGCR